MLLYLSNAIDMFMGKINTGIGYRPQGTLKTIVPHLANGIDNSN